MNKKSLKAFVRIDGSGRVVSGSLILRQKMPKVGKWKQINAYECCGPVIPPTVIDPVVGTITATTIDITWLPAIVAPNESPVTHYIVNLGGVQDAIVAAADVLAYTFTGLTTLTSYDITIVAVTLDSTVSSNIVTAVTI